VRTIRPWVIVAAACATLVGAVGWPLPTLYTLGLVAGTTALVTGVRSLIRGPKNRTTPTKQQVTPGGCTPACADTPGIRGLLEHVGIDTTGRDISIRGVVVDPATPDDTGHATPGRTDQP
jgi:hypothetical protein